MPAYIVTRADSFDPEGMKTYRDQAPDVIAKYGGKFVVRGPAELVLEGDDDGRHTVVIEFPDMDQLKAFWYGDEYAELQKLRQNYSNVVALAVPGFEPPTS